MTPVSLHSYHAGVTSDEVLPDGQRLRARQWGNHGPTIVLLHGLGHSGAVWAAVATYLSECHHVVAVDLRGHGDSDRDATGEYRLTTLATDAAQFINRRAPGTGVVVGHSLGGRIAAELALRRTVPTRGAVIIDNGPRMVERTRAELRRRITPPPRVPLRAHEERLAALYPLAAPAALRPLIDDGLRPVGDGTWEDKTDPAALARWATGHLNEPWPPAAPARAPILLLRGVASAVLTRATAQEMVAEGLVDAVQEIPRSGHAVPLDNPAALASAISAFVTTVVP